MYRDILVLGASTGGVQSIGRVLSELPASFDASIFVVLHLSEESILPRALQPHTPFPTAFAATRGAFEPRHVYVAPPGLHLFLEREGYSVRSGPRENGFRPSIDTTLRSAAVNCGPRVVAAVLSGSMDDGALGAAAVKACGGRVIVQDPDDAQDPELPRNVLRVVQPDAVLPIEQMASEIAHFCSEEAPAAPPIPNDVQWEHDAIRQGGAAMKLFERSEPAHIVCPECGGPINVQSTHAGERFVCHTGHAFSTNTFLAKQDRALEQALYVALRTLQEQVRLHDRIARKEAEAGRDFLAKRGRRKQEELQGDIEVLRSVLDRTNREAGAVPITESIPD